MPITPNFNPENNTLTLTNGTMLIDDEEDITLLSEMSEDELFVLDRIQDDTFDFRYAMDIIENQNYNLLEGIFDNYDLGAYFVDSFVTGEFADPDCIYRRYFDYEAFGSDLRLEGHFIETPRGLIEIID